MQTERRRDPYPFTWEVPAGIVAALALLLVLGVHLGRGLANWAAGAGWRWPQPAALFTAVPGVLAGDAAAGLALPLQVGAPPGQLLGWVITVEVIIAAGAITVTAAGLRRWGPGRLKGMATAAEAEAALGPSRLRRVRSIIRPDLYPANRAALTPSTRNQEEPDDA